MGELFPDRVAASITLAFHARLAWRHREAVSRALRRDNDTCCRCATRIPGWMEIHHLDGNHRDWRQENLAPICHFCHLMQHPAQLGYEDGEFPLEITWWPEVTHAAISAFTWSVVWLQTALWARVDAEQAEADDPEPDGSSLADRLAGYLREVTGEAQRRRALLLHRHDSDVSAMPKFPSEMLSALLPGEPEPEHWQELRFLPTHLRRASVQLGPGHIHRVLSGGRIDQVDLRTVMHEEARAASPEQLLAVADDLRRRAGC